MNRTPFFIIACGMLSIPLLLTGPGRAENSEAVFKNISKGCMREMSSKVINRETATAYCYCYAEELTSMLTPQDFERMGHSGVSDRDQKYFKRARKNCKPKSEKSRNPFNKIFE